MIMMAWLEHTNSETRSCLERLVGWGVHGCIVRLDTLDRADLTCFRVYLAERVKALGGRKGNRTTSRSLRKRLKEVTDYEQRSGVELLGDLVRRGGR